MASKRKRRTNPRPAPKPAPLVVPSDDQHMFVKLPIPGELVNALRERVDLAGQIFETGRTLLGLFEDASVLLEGDANKIAGVIKRRLGTRRE